MAKTLKTSGDYTVKAGAGFNGGAGTNTIDLNSRYVRIRGDLTVDGDQIVQNVQNTTIEDQFLEINRNYSGAGAEDSGIVFNQGTEDDAVFYYDGTSNEFRLGTTSRAIADGSTVKWIIDGGAFSLANIKVATTPSDANHAASKSYVDSQVGSGSATGDLTITGSTIATPSNADLTLTPGGTGAVDMGAIRIRDNHIEGTRSNDDILIQPSGTGAVVIQDILTFEANASTPTAGTITKIYSKTAAGGGTGVFFNNSNISSGTEGELISKKKATALAIALG
jgi:hypothetical protein